MNERLDGVQAAMLRIKLRRLEQWNEARRNLASVYREALGDACRVLVEDRRGECVYHLFPVLVPERDRVRALLSERGVGSGVHYWPAMHRQLPFQSFPGTGGRLPNATRWSEEELSLPLFPELTEAEAILAAEGLRAVLEEVRDGN
jgi:dTDP-4-amino-4,6-dideoxygalactose transaminase